MNYSDPQTLIKLNYNTKEPQGDQVASIDNINLTQSLPGFKISCMHGGG